ncbi:MAG: hypothetical protein ACD_39C00386G0001, partial [uncultured bacterium]
GQLEKNMKSKGIYYQAFNILADANAREIHRALGRNYAGTTATLATPTTIAGKIVLRGSALQPIEDAIKAQQGIF